MARPRSGAPTLILVPTPRERRALDELGGFPRELGPCALTGFGPVSAAARVAQLLRELEPERVLLVGIAGTLAPERAPLAGATSFARVRLDGVGAGSGEAFLPPSLLGLPQWEGERGERVEETLTLEAARAPAAELLTVCAASASPAEAQHRRLRYPEAVAEDMEGFGAALACHLAGVPLAVVRGISNAAGERDARRWRVREALAAARALALEWLRGPWVGSPARAP
jgi:futalosine hydrolase